MLTVDQIQQGLKLLQQPRQARYRGKDVTKPPVAVVDDQLRVGLRETLQAEDLIARAIRRLMKGKKRVLDIPNSVWGALAPDESQEAALKLASEQLVIALTGGPGVGKTTVAKAMLALYRANGLSVMCMAPTGKAAQRMRQQTNHAASTIHSGVGLVPGGQPKFNEAEPLSADVIVIDEMSMVDVFLAASVLGAIATGARVLLIGDVDQLPSIGPGRTLSNIIQSHIVPVVRLTKIHRQAHESRIPYVARDLNQGYASDMSVQGTDVTFWESSDPYQAADRIVRAVTQALPERKGFSPSQIQVLAAQYGERATDDASPIGVVGLNRALQAQLNPAPNAEGDIRGGRGYGLRIGDRVIHTKNTYDGKGDKKRAVVMNGEIGVVAAASLDPLGLDYGMWAAAADWTGRTPDNGKDTDEENEDYGDDEGGGRWDYGVPTKEKDEPVGARFDKKLGKLVFEVPRILAVDYGERKVLYSKDEASLVELAYCITVHKSQGSQFPAVVMVVHSQHRFMLSRALVYTGLTRAEKYCLMVGEYTQLGVSAQNTRGMARRTTLQEKLQQVVDGTT